ncbi:hypothetical protein M5K25_005707 [Dendrobium thyrsiflorum]|uniref:Uncharacterized protein n=1 Tax=Dendrobium thyrsiflorum TaxID=117978 RepID=A0ABD0VI83_DENTH
MDHRRRVPESPSPPIPIKTRHHPHTSLICLLPRRRHQRRKLLPPPASQTCSTTAWLPEEIRGK